VDDGLLGKGGTAQVESAVGAGLSLRGLASRPVALRDGNGIGNVPRPTRRHADGGGFDMLIVGAGFAGSVLAERLASQLDLRVLVVDKRPHIGGNAFDRYNDDGLLIHPYGPHIFHTNSSEVFDYLSNFTRWRPYQHRVLASVDGQLVPIPINLDTVNRLYGLSLSSFELDAFFERHAEKKSNIATSEDVVVARVGRDLYNKLFRGYTRKQWGLDPSDLDASVTARVPVRTNRDDRYFADTYQAMPAAGYTRMFEAMLSHPNIKVMLNTDYREIVHLLPWSHMIYTGPIDAFFDYRYGTAALSQPGVRPSEPAAAALPAGRHDQLPERLCVHALYRVQAPDRPAASADRDRARVPARRRRPVLPGAARREPGAVSPLSGRRRSAAACHLRRSPGQLSLLQHGPGGGAGADFVQATAQRRARRRCGDVQQLAPGHGGGGSIARIVRRVAAGPIIDVAGLMTGDGGLALWVGPEPTVNRVRDRYHDQLDASGFADRLEDIDRLASLGAQRLRFPLLWERLAPSDAAPTDWRWADARMARLRACGLPPIVGLLHHGSGPRDTHLLDRALPRRFAAYAASVARRYPWIDAWTPVNEPLTTARFAGLYGHWYPHRRDDASFLRALMTQVQATVLAMHAVRAVNPAAQLVQTEDLGCTYATPPLQYQADFENERRWLSFDLLCGRVDRGHPLWGYLRRHGVTEDELLALVDAPCAPDIIGINAYITSERYLDHRLDHYPEHAHGGNGRHRYADVERVRVGGQVPPAFEARLRETHRRYGSPMAITEVHLGCTREEQLRWLLSAWRAAQALRAEGAEVLAVTAWAAFGSTDWNTLVTEANGHYEPGLWDVRAPTPRPTALARLARRLAAGTRDAGMPAAPLLALPGWWQRADRHVYGMPRSADEDDVDPPPVAPLLITGATGTLGRAFARMCVVRGIPYRLLRRQEVDIADARTVQAAIARWRPWAIINTAGFVRVDDAEACEGDEGGDRHRCWRDNALGAEVLARACGDADIALVNFSSDLVFDGRKGAPYVESDVPAPLNVYGRAKAAGEQAVLRHCARALVIRTAAFFGPWDPHNFIAHALAALRRGERFHAAADQWVTPTYVPHLVEATLDLLIDGEVGVLHLANRIDETPGAVTWAVFCHEVARAAGLDADAVVAVPGRTLGQSAPRPRHAGLASERLWPMPSLARAIGDYLRDVGRESADEVRVDHGLAVGVPAAQAVEVP
jgi:dTDP-4-dehydrorhamnose reductase